MLFTSVAGCGSSGGDDSSAAETTVADGAETGGDSATPDGDAAKVDACQWYTAEEMGELVGFPVTVEEKETPQGLGSECLYDSAEEYTGITVRPSTAAMYDQLKAGAASTGLGGEQIDFPGVGDEAHHNGAPDATNPSVSFSAKKGDAAVEVELAAASGGTIDTIDKGIEVTSTIAEKVLG
jgi:hypothetical protein